MGYVIAGILVVLIVSAAIAIAVRRATERKGQATIAAPDSNTPLGDTDQHAGEQSREGETVADPEAGRGMDPSTPASPGIGGPGQGGVGGEGEGGRSVTPESERLANKPR
jgi:hypothetical protein